MVPAALLPAVSLVLAQNQAAAPSAATVFYLTLLFIFVTAIVTTVVTKWARDKCLNFINTLRDAFNAAIGAVVGQYQKLNPANAVLSTQGQQVTTISQTLLGRFANAYEPLLEQYIGRQVILEVADPLDPNNATVQYD